MVKNKVIRNTIAMFSGQSGAQVIAMLFTVFLGKMLPDKAFGQIRFAITFVVIFMAFAEYGLQSLLIREIARDKEKAASLFWNSVILKTIFSVIAMFIGWMVLDHFFADFPEKRILVYLVSGSLIFNTWYFSISSVFIGYQENHIETLLFFIGKVIYVAGGVLVVLISRDVKAVALMFSIATGLQCIIAFICLVMRHRHLKFNFDFSIIKYLITHGWQFFSITIFTTLNLKFDNIFIGKWCPDTELGHYAGAYSLILAPIILANAFVRSMYPALSELHNNNDSDFWLRIAKGFRWLAALAFPVLIFMTIDGGRILTTVFKKSFIAGLLPMQILIWGQGLDFFCPFAGHTLYVLNRQKWVIAITGFSLLANIIADVILIKQYGTVGASVAKLIALLVMFGGYAFALRKWLPVNKLFRQLFPPLVISLAFSPVAWYLRPVMPFWISGPIYASLCLGTFFAVKTIKWSDLKLFSPE
ncbi:MAG: hypothetical protein DRI44_06175 [Chlamydiae bacterium]|nr:MAG: hypothetical protein DRI44_06175 [Chlamydiota bacterium]